MIDLNERYMQRAKARLYKRLTVTPGCWIWGGSISQAGYGSIGFLEKVIGAHRVSYIVHFGPIPEGLNVLHRCDNRRCVNPDHLFLGTIRDNNADRQTKGRSVIPNNRGSRNGNAKLTDTQVQQIRDDQRLHREIAQAFHISRATVGDIKNGKRWKHV
jgi:hypothetical protein